MDGNDIKKNKHVHVKVNGDVIRYHPGQNSGSVGCFIMGQTLKENGYFEIKILNAGEEGVISIGVVPYDHDMDSEPGWRVGSAAYHAENGIIYSSSGSSCPIGPRSQAGDIIGCGVMKIEEMLLTSHMASHKSAQVYFTRNGENIGQCLLMVPGPVTDLHPAIGMRSAGEEVEITIYPLKYDAIRHLVSAVDDLMVVDGAEDEWLKTYDVRINGQIVEYTGNGIHIHDVGLAQGKVPLTTTCHYFEMEILEPGEHCYIAIGLVHKNYPPHRHPGWNMGSIAYHADDGKIFLGRGQGSPFGPKCYRGDIMGCGILFPCDYVTPSDGEEEEDEELEEEDDEKPLHMQDGQGAAGGMQDANDILIDLLDDLDDIDTDEEDDLVWPIWRKLDDFRPGRGDEDLLDDVPLPYPVGVGPGNVEERKRRMINWFDDPLQPPPGMSRKICGMMSRRGRPSVANIYGRKGKGLMVKVFFTRNGRRVGLKEVMMPKGGFYPSVGMLSLNEKVRVDLRPLTG